ncbi:LD-transpeptidase YcfS [Salmonella enterica subsp. enterica]|uniref:LD-transpeptidase YcfS n=1 Tax=Salmonella enterica I TaxID=59201 RepID=A0A379WWR2_SALET|nr:LD-transpeptidase YcfS [Salmonella enterica subsp. enterica]
MPLPPPGSRLVGENKFHVVEDDGGSLEAIAKKYNVGFLALLQANPGIDPYVPRAGSVLTIPLQTLLPDAPREGIVINLAELRLYYYQPGEKYGHGLPYRDWPTGRRYPDANDGDDHFG